MRITLVMSLVFAIGQILIGGGAMWYAARRVRTWRAGIMLTFALGLWFFCSGLAELLVSGMEAARDLGRGPNTATFALWHTRADAFLLAVTVVAGTFAFVGPVAIRLRTARRADTTPSRPNT